MEVLVKEFQLSPSPYYKMVARIYQRGDAFIMKMFASNMDMVTGEEKTTLCAVMTSLELIVFQNNIGMVSDYMCFEQPKAGMHRDS